MWAYVNLGSSWRALWKNCRAVSCSFWSEKQLPSTHQDWGESLSTAMSSCARYISSVSLFMCQSTVE